MHVGFAGPTVPAAAKGPQFAQFAEFDVGGKKNEDALPQMPSWEGAEHKKVLVEEEAVEMNALKKPEAGGQAAGAAAIGGAAGASSPVGPRSPVNRSPYGPPGGGPGGPGADGFFAASAIGNNGPYAQGAPGYNQPGMAYSEPGQGYGMAARAMSPGPRSPHGYNNVNGGYNDGYNNGGYGQAQDYHDTGRQDGYDNYGAAQHQPYDNYDTYNSPANQGYGIARHQTPHEMDATPYRPDSRNSARRQGPYGPEARRSPAPQGQYGGGYGPESRRSPVPQAQYGAAYTAERRGSPAPQGEYARRSPAPQGDYNNGSSGGYDNRPYGRAPPQRQFSASSNHNNNSNAMQAPSPLRNEAGFDFTSGYSRPPPGDAAVGVGYRQPSSPTADEQAGAAYPGYKPYQRAA
jgi:hypothetical protein